VRRILHRYIFVELLKVLFLSTAALTFFLAIAYALSQLRERGLGPADSVQLVLYFVPAMLVFAMPISALLTTTLVYGRLSSDNELTACRASGISMSSLLWPALAVGLLIGCANFVLFDRVIPWAKESAARVGTDHIERIFFNRMQTKKSFEYKAAGFYIYAKHTEGHMLYGVVARYSNPNGQRFEAKAPAAYVRFYKPEAVTEVPTAAKQEPGKAHRKTREEVASEPGCWDASVTNRGRAMVQFFDVYASDESNERSMLESPTIWEVLMETQVLQPGQMTLSQLSRRLGNPRDTFEYKYARSAGAGPVALDALELSLRAATVAEMQSRYASMASCVLLVGLGAALGTMFRHGHILTAFAVSMGPGLFAIFAVLLGVHMVKAEPGHANSLIWVMWLGNMVVAVLDAILVGRLLRQ
jgi:lipopolysaccharide export LptBFGC system permease protein LptF